MKESDKMSNINARKIKVNSCILANISFVLFFSRNFLLTVSGLILPGYSTVISVSLVYGFAIAACVLNPKKYIKLDSVVLYIGIVMFYLITSVIHPEYMPYYNRIEYGVWDHVFNPFRGIPAYFFVRLIDNEQDFYKLLRKSGFLSIVYFLYTYYLSTTRGYWYGVGMGLDKGSIEMSYSVTFGYKVLPVAILFLYFTFKEKKAIDLLSAITCIVLIFIGGSRGPVLFVGVFIVLYIFENLPPSNRKWLIIASITGAGLLLYILYDYLLLFIIGLFSNYGLSSRFLTKLMEGTISSDSGRNYIWNMAMEMIKQRPFGYGFMGSRHVIGTIIIAGYPHSIVLEMLIDFGVIIGNLILAIIIVGSIRILFNKRENVWKDAYLIYFCSACCLLISLTFWSESSFWVCLGIAINRYISIAKRRHKK